MPQWHETIGILLAEINPSLLARAAQEIGWSAHISFTCNEGEKDRQIQHLLLALRAEMEEGCPAGRVFGESLATTLAIHLVRRYSISSVASAKYRGGLARGRLRQLVEYIDQHLDQDVSLQQLAALAQMSNSHLAHVFKQSTGLAPHQFVLRQRIEKAKQLLLEDRLSLAEISLTLGFASQAHFTTIFRKFVGFTPMAYRKFS
jgi:AraC family transcriptional regulator